MQNTTFRPLQIAVFFLFLLISSVGRAQSKVPPTYKASPLYVTQLPKFCWHQYVDGSLDGPRYSIVPSSCGYQMNHFCPALVFLLEAQNASLGKTERQGSMAHAVQEINYTLRDMKPGCHIAAEVYAARDKAKMLAPIIGVR
ncbi:MAG: hypothetical protein K2X64_06425 [Rhodocyclaceae bacterium]|nr:hypothetical protein [Rhodocyclaceae bacterium]